MFIIPAAKLKIKIFLMLALGLFLATGSATAQNISETVEKGAVQASTMSQKALQQQLFRSLSKPLVAARDLPSSHFLRERYLLVTTDLENLRAKYAQSGLEQLISDEQLATRLSNLQPIHQEGAPLLSELGQQQKKLLALWEQALLKERNPNFLSRKAPKNILLFEVDPVKEMNALVVSPRFFREWAFLIEQESFLAISETAGGLIGALRKDLMKIEQNAGKLTRIYLQAQTEAQNPALGKEAVALAKKKMDLAKGALSKLSNQAAQDVLDLVHILNLYPAVSNDSLTLLAAKLDGLKEKNPFVELLRSKIKIESSVSAPKRRIGFN